MKNIILFALFALSIFVTSCEVTPGLSTDFDDVPELNNPRGGTSPITPFKAEVIIENNQARVAGVHYVVQTNNDVDSYIVNNDSLLFVTSPLAFTYFMRDVKWKVWHEGQADTLTTSGYQSTFVPNGVDDIRIQCKGTKGTIANPQQVTSLMSFMLIQ